MFTSVFDFFEHVYIKTLKNVKQIKIKNFPKLQSRLNNQVHTTISTIQMLKNQGYYTFLGKLYYLFLSKSIHRSNKPKYLIITKINPFQTNVPFLYPLKMSENQRFLTFSGGIKREHWPEIGLKNLPDFIV